MTIEDSLAKIALALEKIAKSLDSANLEVVKDGAVSSEASFQQPVSEVTKPQKSDIIEFLKTKGIAVKTLPAENDFDEILDRIAVFMGEKYSSVQKVLEQIKRAMNSAGSINLSLQNWTQEEVSLSCQLCNQLYQIAFLENYRYFKSPRFQLICKPNKIPRALNFFSGQWLERFVRKQVEDILIANAISFAYIVNPQVILPNGDDFEFDIMFYCNDQIFWFEAKTGEYQRYVEKYQRVAKMLNLQKFQSYMILTDIQRNIAKNLSALFSMNVVFIEDFKDDFCRALIELLPSKNFKYEIDIAQKQNGV